MSIMPPIDLSDPRTKITISVVMLIAFGVGCWNARAYFDDFQQNLQHGQIELKSAIEESRREYIRRADTNAEAIVRLANGQVSYSSFQVWAYKLERENRGLQREDGKSGLIVPEPVRASAP